MKKVHIILVCVVLLTGCVGGYPARVQIKNAEWEVPPFSGAAFLYGVVENVGTSNISYLEISVKLTQNGVTVATGWTNLTQLAAGESRKFSIIVYDFPEGEFDFEFVTSTKTMGVPI